MQIQNQFHIINIQRRLADYHWSKAETWEQAKDIHAQWMSDHNFQDHWAHKDCDFNLSVAPDQPECCAASTN